MAATVVRIDRFGAIDRVTCNDGSIFDMSVPMRPLVTVQRPPPNTHAHALGSIRSINRGLQLDVGDRVHVLIQRVRDQSSASAPPRGYHARGRALDATTVSCGGLLVHMPSGDFERDGLYVFHFNGVNSV